MDDDWGSLDYEVSSEMLLKHPEEFQFVISKSLGDVVVSMTHLPTKVLIRGEGHSEFVVKKVLTKMMDRIFLEIEKMARNQARETEAFADLYKDISRNPEA